jgi:tripartite-type tricarboxylate transporter receptor subunit TctC
VPILPAVRLTLGLALGGIAAAVPAAAYSQAYPAREIRIIVPFPPGGQQDTMARLLGQHLTGPLGKNVLVENRPGAGGLIGAEAAARSAPDGYTVFMGSASTLCIQPALNAKLPYTPSRDFVPVTLLAHSPHVLAVHPQVPANTVTEFVAYAKAQAKPLAFASVGSGTPHHLAAEIFKNMTGLNMVHIPYKGTAPAVVDLISGQVQFMSVELPSAQAHIRGGKMRALGLAASSRTVLMPELPTVAESGLPGFEISSWSGIVAPAGMPRASIDRLSAEINKALATPEMKDGLAKMGAAPLGGTADDFSAYLRKETVMWSKAVKDSGVKVE